MNLVRFCKELGLHPRRVLFIHDDVDNQDVRVAIRARGLHVVHFRGAAAQSLRDYLSRLPWVGPDGTSETGGSEPDDPGPFPGGLIHGEPVDPDDLDGGPESAVRQ